MTPLATPSNCSNPYARKGSAPSGIPASADELRRNHLLRRWVKRGKKRGQDEVPRPLMASALCRPVGEDNDARAEDLRVHELQSCCVEPVAEEPLALPHDDGKTMSRYSSTRSCSISAFASSALPYTSMSLPSCCLSLATPSATSPFISVELFHSSGSSSVVETTCLG